MTYVPPILDLVINQNASFDYSLQITDDSGNPVNITDWQFLGSIKAKYKDVTPATSFVFTIVDIPTATVRMYLSPSQTASLKGSSYFYDVLAVIVPGVDAERLMEGRVTVRPAVT